ncbi:MAG: T9SS type A sorting domain-containing protein [Saprospiraceae bacterium]|nr:T9SS type A sorting domain-containing protein [Saprospiraceae bacterium]NNK90414.1 T9SS type A sorting domain-containing protein [Saprospiraceae bacterium]
MQMSSVIYNISCYGATDGSIAVTVFGGLPGFEYSWEDENGNILTGNPVESLGPGTYSLVVKDASGEVLQETYDIVQPEEITVEALVEHTSGGLDNGTIDLEIAGGNGGFMVLWDHGSTETSLIDLPAGEYHVVITDTKGCTIEETYTVQSSTNVNEIDFINDFKLHPNPASGFVSIDIKLDRVEEVELSVISLLGQENYKRTYQSNGISEIIDISDLTGGVYLVQLRSKDKIALKKLVIAN